MPSFRNKNDHTFFFKPQANAVTWNNCSPKSTRNYRCRFVPKTVEDLLRRLVQEVVTYREQNNVVRADYLQFLISLKTKASGRETANGHDSVPQKGGTYGLMLLAPSANSE
jgi:hypothetical protein